jgi:beta-lactam-binding protein with PASTA domain
MRLSEAKRLFEAFEIMVQVENDESIWNEKNWKVVKIIPAPGTTFKKRRQVTLEVSK